MRASTAFLSNLNEWLKLLRDQAHPQHSRSGMPFWPWVTNRSGQTPLCEAQPGCTKVVKKVNLPKSDPPDVIALHSPKALIETGLRMCLPEKRRDEGPLADGQSVL